MGSGFPEHLFDPPPGATQPPPRVLSKDEDSKLDSLIEHFNSPGFELPLREESEEKEKLGEREMMFLSKGTLTRFLVACKGDLAATKLRLEKCIVWRRTMKVDDIDHWESILEPESHNGKTLTLGFSPHSQPILYFFPARNDTPIEKRNPLFAVFLMERAYDLAFDGVNNIVVIFNFKGKKKGPSTSPTLARQMIGILGDHYPETLAMAYMQEVPFFVRTLINIMWPFIDPNTKKKITIVYGDPRSVVEKGDLTGERLLQECGGDLDLPYDHTTYWPALMARCKAERAKALERWRSLGEPRVGRDERLFKVFRAPAGTTEVNGEEKVAALNDAPPAAAEIAVKV